LADLPSPENKLMSIEVVSEKILKHFNKTFKNAESIKWEQRDARIVQDNPKIWIIKLAGKRNYAAIRIENATIEEIENFQKAN
jgi:hypothetical protein